MYAAIDRVLSEEELVEVRAALDELEFVDGKATAGPAASEVKDNLQLDRSDAETAGALDAVVLGALARSEKFRSMLIPHRFAAVLYSRYDPGMQYGDHLDNAYMLRETSQPVRSDVSVTVFLNEPDEYEGGELVVQTSVGEYSEKLPAGSAILYPSTTVHRVEPVVRGRRFAAVTWVQSYVRDLAIREMMHDIDRVARSLRRIAAQSEETELLAKTYQNMLRRFGEI